MNISFEACHWTNESYTHRIVEENGSFPLFYLLSEKMVEENPPFLLRHTRTEGVSGWWNSDDFIREASFPQKNNGFFHTDIPMECFFASSIRGANMYGAGGNFYYCEEDSNSPGNMSVTDDEDKLRVIWPRRACLSRDYVELTANAFNETADCFGFSQSEKESIFKLLNHESSFLHNIASPTGAKCYGQLTRDTIEEINKQIYFRDTAQPLPYSYIFDEVIERCPGLQTAVVDGQIIESVEEAGDKSMKKFTDIVSRMPVSCKITQTPYSCLFYAFYNIKKNIVRIRAYLNRSSSYADRKGIPVEFREQFLLPVKLNEMLIVTNTEGKGMVFWDDSELWLSSLKNYPSEKIEEIKKIPLFASEEEVVELFSYWAYNGGISISLTYMPAFIKQLKQSIARPCPPDSEEQNCQYRFSIQKGFGLQTADIKRDFQVYIRERYTPKDLNGNGKQQSNQTANEAVDSVAKLELQTKLEIRRREVANFVDNVSHDLNYLYNKNGAFKVHLSNLIPSLEEKEIEAFQAHLEATCPSI